MTPNIFFAMFLKDIEGFRDAQYIGTKHTLVVKSLE